ncbi:hypothetical protein BDW60DRAFT_102113 [Aspergillus nidulans var. acristatus]
MAMAQRIKCRSRVRHPERSARQKKKGKTMCLKVGPFMVYIACRICQPAGDSKTCTGSRRCTQTRSVAFLGRLVTGNPPVVSRSIFQGIQRALSVCHRSLHSCLLRGLTIAINLNLRLSKKATTHKQPYKDGCQHIATSYKKTERSCLLAHGMIPGEYAWACSSVCCLGILRSITNQDLPAPRL